MVNSKEFLNEVLFRRLLYIIPDPTEAGEMANALQDEVMQDIVETADSDYWHSGDVEIALARVLRKRLGLGDEPEKVYVFTAEQAWDGEIADVIVRTFRKKDAAHEFMHKFIHDPMSDESTADYVKRKGWEVEVDEPDLYRAYPYGYYPTDHIELTITECNIE